MWRLQVLVCNTADQGSLKRLVPWDEFDDTTVALHPSAAESCEDGWEL